MKARLRSMPAAFWRRLAFAVLYAFAAQPAVAQPPQDEILYFDTDAIGSVRLVTDASANVVERHDFQPFGVESPTTSQNNPLFAGQERDSSAMDYWGARYYDRFAGRLTTVDPLSIGTLSLVNPQRMNRYTYALNNPLSWIDPTGKDAIIVNFSEGARGLGHAGIIVLEPDGRATFADFGPAGAGSMFGASAGRVFAVDFHIDLDSKGKPTFTSLAELSTYLGKTEGYRPESIRFAYFKTSPAETAKLRAYIDKSVDLSKAGSLKFSAALNNCDKFCMIGASQAGIIGEESALYGGNFVGIPNIDWWWLRLIADVVYGGWTITTETGEYHQR